MLAYDFMHDINAYLTTRSGLSVYSLADLIAFNNAHADKEMHWFGQEKFIEAEEQGTLHDNAYIGALASAKRFAGPEGIDAALRAHHLDALLAPGSGACIDD